MVTTRSRVGNISRNIQRGKELTAFERGQITGGAILGHNTYDIAKVLNIPRRTVRTTLERSLERPPEGLSKPRCGRPKKYSIKEERILVRHVRQFPKHTYAQVLLITRLDIKRSTVQTILKKHNITNWRAKRRPELSAAYAKTRYRWCKAREKWKVEDWKKYMWSDECSCERGRGKMVEWVFHTPHQKWEPQFIQTYRKGKDISVMVWGCF